mgnify:CR=1 FL=1
MTSVDHFLQLEQRSRFMATNISDVVRTTTAQRCRCRILELLNVYFVKRGIVVVFHTKHRRTEQVVIIDQFRIPDGMDLFPPTNGFVGSQCVNVLEEMW